MVTVKQNLIRLCYRTIESLKIDRKVLRTIKIKTELTSGFWSISIQNHR